MLEDIKGLGPKTILALNSLGINNISDLLMYYPYRYNIYKPDKLESNIKDNILINGIVEEPIRVFFIKKNLNRLSFKFNTGSNLINVVIFNRAFLKPNLNVGKEISIIGKYDAKKNTFTASDIKLTPILNETIECVYHLNQSIKKANLKKVILNLINNNYYVKDYVPEYLSTKYKFLSKTNAIKEIHNPSDMVNLKKAKVSLIYEELFIFMLKMNYLKIFKNNVNNSNIKKVENNKFNNFINKLPFKLTKDQVNAIEDIKKDFNSEKRMNRLLLGDVGSGKTVVAFASLYLNFLSGYQGIMMAPTEILAEQHYNNIVKLFDGLDINIAFLSSSVKKSERNEIIKDLNDNNIDILIGTHSVLNDDIKFKNLGLVITDEQHRFGVNQRKNLQKKGVLVDVLYMSATPIPRTLALTIYGDMDISMIKTKPENRKEIKTNVYKNGNIKEVLYQMVDEIKLNHQIYVVAPLIEDENETGMESVNELYKKLDVAFNGKVPIGLLHGKLKNDEKQNIINDFKENKIKILVSTTVIEVGVDIKNATMMVIFNAERFGLATLHQLRGRIGRNDIDSKCILISDFDTPRLKILEESNDGFYISEKDFELRGSGDLFGVKQSGDMNFKLANLSQDYKILLRCKEDSEEFLNLHLTEIEKYPNQAEIINSISFNA